MPLFTRSRVNKTAEGALGIGLLGTALWVVRIMFEVMGDAQTAESIAKHSASIAHLFSSGIESIVRFFLSPLGSGVTVLMAGGYLWIDNRRHKRDTSISQSRQTIASQHEEQPPRLVIASPLPDLPTVAASAASPPSVAEPEERVFVNLAPHELMMPFETQVEVQAVKSVSRYIGKWYRVMAQVNNIQKYRNDWTIRVFVDRPDRIVGTQIAMEFPLSAERKIELLDKGTVVNVIGQIQAITSNVITLEHCEFVS
jgi:hypothetical protein